MCPERTCFTPHEIVKCRPGKPPLKIVNQMFAHFCQRKPWFFQDPVSSEHFVLWEAGSCLQWILLLVMEPMPPLTYPQVTGGQNEIISVLVLHIAQGKIPTPSAPHWKIYPRKVCRRYLLPGFNTFTWHPHDSIKYLKLKCQRKSKRSFDFKKLRCEIKKDFWKCC